MIVIIKQHGDEIIHENVAAVVRGKTGLLYFCRDGKPDEYIDAGAVVTVVNDG